ncbi:MAG: putative porin [Endomicrobium sp.]|jgi:hypothetical protein|nr:putative porin [Endomicrobium sp.]
MRVKLGTKQLQKVVLALTAAVFMSGAAFAGEVDKLASVLAEKGVITYGEAQRITTETGEDIKAQTASGTNPAIPAWVQNIKFSGDIRLRFQSDWSAGDNTRDRERMRLRFGFEARPVQNVTAAFGFATGKFGGVDGADAEPTSTNATFAGFNKLPIGIDYAYLSYDINNIGKISAGKIKSGMTAWNLKQLIWDGDINPDGVSFNMNKDLGKGFTFFGNAGWLIINGDVRRQAELADVYILQPGVTYKTGNIGIKAALGYQQFNTKGRHITANNNIAFNSATDYRLINPAVEASVSEVIGKYVVKVFGEYVKNTDDALYKNNNEGGLYGITFGDGKIGNRGDWNITYAGRYLMAGAVPAALSFSDAYGGAADVRGFEIGINYGLTKNTSFAFNYLSYDRINGAKDPRSLAQCDISYKF